MLSPWGETKRGSFRPCFSILRAVERLQAVGVPFPIPDRPKRTHGQKIGLGGQRGRPAGEIFSIQGIEGSRSRQDGPCLSVTGPVSEAAGLEPDGAVIHPRR